MNSAPQDRDLNSEYWDQSTTCLASDNLRFEMGCHLHLETCDACLVQRQEEAPLD